MACDGGGGVGGTIGVQRGHVSAVINIALMRACTSLSCSLVCVCVCVLVHQQCGKYRTLSRDRGIQQKPGTFSQHECTNKTNITKMRSRCTDNTPPTRTAATPVGQRALKMTIFRVSCGSVHVTASCERGVRNATVFGAYNIYWLYVYNNCATMRSCWSYWVGHLLLPQCCGGSV